jgi:hypothetical protein
MQLSLALQHAPVVGGKGYDKFAQLPWNLGMTRTIRMAGRMKKSPQPEGLPSAHRGL